MNHLKRILSGLLLILLWTTAVQAQEVGEFGGDFSGLPVDLLPPGARSLGLGGAFAGVADDATAAVANPAGLTNLSTTEVSLHMRNFDSDVEFFDPDAFDSALNSHLGQLNKTYSDSSSDISFASIVKPFDNWVISGYYLNQLGFKSSQAHDDVVNDDVFYDSYTNFNSVDAAIEAFGASVAYRLSGAVSLGLTVQNTTLDLATMDVQIVDNYNDFEFLYDDPAAAVGQIVDRYTLGNLIGGEFGSDSSDSDTTINAGLLWSVSQKISLGLVYRQGAEFKMNSAKIGSYEAGCVAGATIPDCDYLAEVDANSGYVYSELAPVTIKIPDTITLGLAWRPSNTVLLSLDLNNIGYSDSTPVRNITQGFGFNIDSNDPSASFSRSDFNDPAVSGRTGPYTEKIDDATTVHFGIEKVFRRPGEFMSSLTLRGGAFTVEDHDGAIDIDSSDTVFTVGLGAVLGGDARGRKQFQLDLGASFGDNSTNIILSGIYRF